MKADIPYIEEAFQRFNALCFDGMLPPVKIVLSHAKTFLGKLEYKIVRDRFGNVVGHEGYILKISTWYDLPENELEDVIIHEMIHYYIAFRNIKDSSVHGNVFKRMMNSLNSEFGRNITIRRSGSMEILEDGSARINGKKRMVCVTTLDGGLNGITVCTPAKAVLIHAGLKRFYNIRSIAWYLSDDPWFDNFPLSRKPRIYRSAKEDIDRHIADAQPVFLDGKLAFSFKK